MPSVELAEHGRVLNENVALRVALSQANATIANLHASAMKRREAHSADLKEALTALQSAMGVIADRNKEKDDLMALLKQCQGMMEAGFQRPRLAVVP
jgi:hypothetical protein